VTISASEVQRLQHHASQDQRAQRHLVDDPTSQRRDQRREQGGQGQRKRDLAAAPTQALLQGQHEQAKGAAIQGRDAEHGQHAAASQRTPAGWGIGGRDLG
jgi:hypothetical protein